MTYDDLRKTYRRLAVTIKRKIDYWDAVQEVYWQKMSEVPLYKREEMDPYEYDDLRDKCTRQAHEIVRARKEKQYEHKTSR